MKTSRTGTQESIAIANKIADVSFDITKLSKRFIQYDSNYEQLDNQLKEEVKLRQNIEKKTFFMNENLNEQIKTLKGGFSSLSSTITDQIAEIKTKILEDVQSSNSKFLKSFEANMLQFQAYEKNMISIDQKNQIDSMNLDKKISIVEDVLSNQINNIKIELKATQDKNELMTKQIESNALRLNESIQQTNKELQIIKNDIEMLKRYKLASSETFGKISDDIIYSNEHISKCVNDISVSIKDTDSKLKHFENSFNRLNDSFGLIKSDVYIQLDDLKDNYKKKIEKINDELMSSIKECKIEMEKFNINMIEENQKFIEYNQGLVQNQTVNMKKLYDFTNDDIDILKKKCESIENITITMRGEMIDNINHVESFLTQRYDSIFKTLGSERSMR